jgi:ABC-2 type transport system permease protein
VTRSLLPSGPIVAGFGRSAREGRRDPGPAFFLPGLPPLLLVIAMTSILARLNRVVAFPTGSFKEYFVPGAAMITALAGAGFTAGRLAEDLRDGYIDRLRLNSPRLRVLLLGRFGFEAVRVVPAVVAVLAVGLAFGGALPNGLPGAITVVVLAMLLSAAYAGLFYVVAILTEDPQTPTNLNPLGIVLAFLSSAFVPRSAMPGWAGAIAAVNPVTVIVDGARAAMIGDLWSGRVALALGAGVAGLGLAVIASTVVLERKLARP